MEGGFFYFIEAALHNGAVTNEMDADGLQKNKEGEREMKGKERLPVRSDSLGRTDGDTEQSLGRGRRRSCHESPQPLVYYLLLSFPSHVLMPDKQSVALTKLT